MDRSTESPPITVRVSSARPSVRLRSRRRRWLSSLRDGTRSEPDDLGGAHDGVLPGDGVPADGLVVEAAVVAVRVAVRAAEELPAAAPEPREPDALPAALAPVHGRGRR